MIILFWLAKYRINKAGEAPLYMRITYEGKRAEVGLGQYVLLKHWDNKRQKVKGDSDLVKQVNSIINSFKTKALATYDELFKTNCPITAEIIKNKLLGIDEQRKTLLEVFHYHNEQMKAKIGIEFAANTLKKYITCERKVVAFIEAAYHRKDVFLAELNYKFITDFDFYLKTKDKLKQNAVVKHVQQLKRIIKVSMLHGWLSNDPFINYSCKLKEVLRGYLTSDEVAKLASMDLSNNKRLDEVRDVFLFCCYTGLSYADVEKLNFNHISKGIDNNYWIILNRTKTESRSAIPVLPQAQEILEKYKSQIMTAYDGKVLPVKSNQKMNVYLKEIATKAEITKRVSMHLARHTFATSITLTNGVDIVTVSRMLGHKNIKTTQIYAKVVDTKVSNDMQQLKEKLSGNNLKKVANGDV
ncbi:site-specific integrase [Chitinophaga sp. CC14]|uniref:site-specific integrase n=1 Tax=Chitinophaga sp. CC14 TaxID=3029199 RepID=UPI003B776789